jgi:tetratricopeptide (TPR) repeat protein
MERKTRKTKAALTALLAALLSSVGGAGCASLRNTLAINTNSGASAPIHNPFGDQYAKGEGDRSQNLILRTKKGDRSVEIELPRDSQAMTDFTIPVSPAFRDSAQGRDPASASGSGEGTPYVKLPPTMADHEITRNFPQGASNDQEGERRSIEEGLGVMPTEDSVPSSDQSYLGALDNVKSLYRQGRYEAGLVEIDGLIRQYPTSPKLHLMRGTLLDRVGQLDLAIKSWNQALRLEPKNESLRKFIERRENKRSLASP